MRGQGSDWVRRTGEFRRLRAASDFPSDGKVTKGSPGDGSGWALTRPYSPYPGPHYGGRTPEKLCVISGAQNLSGWSEFPPGHWALGLQKLPLLRFHSCAWVSSANAPGAYPGGRPLGLPYPIPEDILENRRGGRLPLSRGDVEHSETEGIGNCPSRRSLKGPVVRRRGGTPGRPPLSTAQLEPRRSKSAVKKWSAMLLAVPLPNLTAAPSAGEKQWQPARCPQAKPPPRPSSRAKAAANPQRPPGSG